MSGACEQRLCLKTDPFPEKEALDALWKAAWTTSETIDFANILSRSLAHICAFEEDHLIGFINIATDGGQHAFILDPCVHPASQRKGVGTALVKEAIVTARSRGASWLHVDYEPHLEGFYRSCGFTSTKAGLIKL
ncbi:GNAT family N-acetyltransferase [Oryzifoliimicrobium ureilyticus]|uniref:GNAT family N-acetyltransferase n=1 Tax=Oryzifoliimicrobium ureilyticus TaxID=3113724 RepID=UPI003076760E